MQRADRVVLEAGIAGVLFSVPGCCDICLDIGRRRGW